jgi:hypothetical protein
MQEFNMYDSGPVIGAGSRDTFLNNLAGVAKAEHLRSSFYFRKFLLMIHPRGKKNQKNRIINEEKAFFMHLYIVK